MRRVPHDDTSLVLCGNDLYYPRDARPSIRSHVDGPLLRMRDGQLHWLTPWERLLFWLGRTDAETLERKWWDRNDL